MTGTYLTQIDLRIGLLEIPTAFVKSLPGGHDGFLFVHSKMETGDEVRLIPCKLNEGWNDMKEVDVKKARDKLREKRRRGIEVDGSEIIRIDPPDVWGYQRRYDARHILSSIIIPPSVVIAMDWDKGNPVLVECRETEIALQTSKLTPAYVDTSIYPDLYELPKPQKSAFTSIYAEWATKIFKNEIPSPTQVQEDIKKVLIATLMDATKNNVTSIIVTPTVLDNTYIVTVRNYREGVDIQLCMNDPYKVQGRKVYEKLLSTDLI